MAWKPKQRKQRPWRKFLTAEEAKRIAEIDSLSERVRELRPERDRIQVRASVRAGRAS